jgi:hypothetical protein
MNALRLAKNFCASPLNKDLWGKWYGTAGAYLAFCQGETHFWLTYPLPPPDLDLDPGLDPHQDFELDPDPAPDPHQNNADPQCGSVAVVWQIPIQTPKDLYHLKKTSLFQFVKNLCLDRLNIGVKDATKPVLRIDLTVPSLGNRKFCRDIREAKFLKNFAVPVLSILNKKGIADLNNFCYLKIR